MKKLITLFLATVLVFTLSAGISADEQVIKQGTAVVDGVLDAGYKESLVLKGLGSKDNLGTVITPEWNGTAQMDAYFMYDEQRLYMCAVVTDDDVLTKGEEYAHSNNPYENDVAEFKFSMDGTNEIFKVSIDAYGYNVYGLYAHYEIIDYSAIVYATKITDTGYVVEASIPCTKGDLDMIAAGKLGILWQLNDLDINGVTGLTSNFYQAYPTSNDNVSNPVFYNLSNEKVTSSATSDTTAKQEDTTAKQEDTTAKQEDTTAKQEDTTAKQEDTTAKQDDTTPSTFDPIVVAVALTAASGAAFVVASKKRK